MSEPFSLPARQNPRSSLGEVEAILALGSLIIFGAVTGVVLFCVVPEKNEKYVMLMLGALIGVVKDTFGRYFQATKGSQEQRRDFADLAVAAASSAGPPLAPGTARVEAAANVDVAVSSKPVAPPDDDLEIPSMEPKP